MLIYNPVDFFISRGLRRFHGGHLIRPCCHSGQCRVCLALKTQGGINFFEELRPERPKAHSPGQGEQRELAPWVCSTPTTWRPERAQALNHTNKYVGLSRIGVELLPFQGATYGWGFCPRVSLLAVACPGLGAIALSGRGMIVHCSTC